MKRINLQLVSSLLLFLPGYIWAHPGHDDNSLVSHHFVNFELSEALALAALIAGIYLFKYLKSRQQKL